MQYQARQLCAVIPIVQYGFHDIDIAIFRD
jgi:hypothetical protein